MGHVMIGYTSAVNLFMLRLNFMIYRYDLFVCAWVKFCDSPL